MVLAVKTLTAKAEELGVPWVDSPSWGGKRTLTPES